MGVKVHAWRTPSNKHEGNCQESTSHAVLAAVERQMHGGKYHTIQIIILVSEPLACFPLTHHVPHEKDNIKI